jgi:hypothetical protein
MWARHIEAVVAVWIAFSWLIFRYTADLTAMQINDTIISLLIILFSLITYQERFRYCHLLNFLIGLWLIGWVVYSGTGIEFGPHQNYMVSGLLLLMLSIVPSRTKEPPKAWVAFLSKKKEKPRG